VYDSDVGRSTAYLIRLDGVTFDANETRTFRGVRSRRGACSRNHLASPRLASLRAPYRRRSYKAGEIFARVRQRPQPLSFHWELVSCRRRRLDDVGGMTRCCGHAPARGP